MIRSPLLALALCAAALAGCQKWPDGSMHLIGQPKPDQKWKPPSAETNPAALFSQNCLACHSAGATTSAAISMNNPIYLAVVPPETLKNVIAHGVPNSRMPAFATSEGGSLTDEQINLVVADILKNKKPVDGALPPYSAPLGNAAGGQAVYEEYVASLKKTAPASMFQDGFMTNPAFLGLFTDQYLRTLIIAGQPDLGIPDYRNAIPGHSLSDQEIADMTAWLVSNRRNDMGQPLTSPNP